ncbi:MAG: type II toxin-antitoxin system HicA family toxin [Patescibacteria group bacterium]|nr:type II toxin-antitoxin system HicA family toxin [Patescibacteria group bacterium]
MSDLSREVEAQLKQAGWELNRHPKGGHTIWKKKGAKRPIVVSHGLHDKGMMLKTLREAGLR